ncbi:N-acetylmuramoyl-L-alanine amidase [Dokdonia sp. Hel_I_53]|uniref:N-acetylmuramoyl-L-alanine amidase family protein n=1 Tax=Dokdonia sp. Hel_I_53 TaxID=1566287 RepID=UPI00119C172E|nr:N-acetylmuramoyl-L-alanine amidase [Dokdonia sp. Hel_I_53]TVZ51095.1 N-acetylmuramoyl-L-alanine amidase [Dokdonia sp. Hel_I_53]
MRKKNNFNIYLTILLLAGSLIHSAFAKAQTKQREKFKIVLDAGHGGKDSGNRGNGYYEKNIALNVVLAIGGQLEQLDDVEVIYTRKKDVFLELWERADIANNSNADLFISVHCNSHSSQAKGTETFVLGIGGNAKNMAIAKKENSVILLEDNYEKRYAGFDPNKPETSIGLELMQEEYLDQSINLASFIENEFTSTVKRSSRGVKQAIFWVLHRSVMPSVLIETGFLTNNEEGRFLNSKNGQEKMASAISKAVVNYKESIQAVERVALIQKEAQTSIEPIENETAIVDKPISTPGITFKVQVAASKTMLETQPYNFKQLINVTRVRDNNFYKYYYKSTNDYAQARKYLEEAKLAGYEEAFIVSFNEQNIKVPLNQVLN